ncbi:mersacidin/lichenicidin family type 2 lantibiotic [Ktedonospora formicarum]|uniref:Mersacidin/lichenicidin family type 2 lantibiotic n=1 Tax=Ktedonospora formicarum TaxID=2778364 RepID=A0A8J3MXP5_9CHLR|nr:mersacidin/lichenicidin family type 2 lantibiotic [Ktedonospora formicarum]GHO49948.1 hypothetical protein KSX_81110 [Ktedonospora formicarum]
MNIDIVRTWKDEAYRQNLQRKGMAFPENPVGDLELTDEELLYVVGGARNETDSCTAGCTDLCSNSCTVA